MDSLGQYFTISLDEILSKSTKIVFTRFFGYLIIRVYFLSSWGHSGRSQRPESWRRWTIIWSKVDGLKSKVDSYKGSEWTAILTQSTLTPYEMWTFRQDRPFFIKCRMYSKTPVIFLLKPPLFSTKTPVGIQNPRFFKNTKTPVLLHQNPRWKISKYPFTETPVWINFQRGFWYIFLLIWYHF